MIQTDKYNEIPVTMPSSTKIQANIQDPSGKMNHPVQNLMDASLFDLEQ